MLPVYITGIRDQETIIGTSDANKNTLIKVKGFYPPSVKGINSINKRELFDKLSSITFFSSMDDQQKWNYLTSVAINDPKLYLDEVPLKLKFLRINGEGFTYKLTPEQIEYLISGNPEDKEGYWNITDVLNMFPKKTLIFRPSIWALNPEYKEVKKYRGICIDVINCELSHSMEADSNTIIYLFDIFNFGEIAIKVNKPQDIDIDQLFASQMTNKSYYEIYNIISWFTPAIHKSLIQKIIRTSAKYITYKNTKYDSIDVLITSFLILLVHKGTFVPDIQKFQRGLESACKRLAVSINEDSYVENYNEILCLFASALVAQNIKQWFPSHDLISRWINLCILAYHDKRLFNYDNKIKNIPTKINSYTLSYFLISQLGSFESDINMVSTTDGSYKVDPNFEDIEEIPIYHCLDHHATPDILLFMPKVYENLFQDMWKYVSGINPRKGKKFIKNEFFNNVREAQKLLWLSRTVKPLAREKMGKTVEYKYTLDKSWLSGLLGNVEFNIKHTTVIATLRPDDLSINVIKKPSRDSKDVPQLTDEEKYLAYTYFEQMLENGIKLKSNIFPDFKVVKKINDEYYINNINLSDAFNLKDNFMVLKHIKSTVENSFIYQDYGIDENSDQFLNLMLEKFSDKNLRRLIYYINNYKSKIELNTNDGQDTSVFYFLSYLCILYPAFISHDKSDFNIKPLFWVIRDKIIKYFNDKNKTVNINWNVVAKDKLDRPLWEHQIDSLQRMIDRKNNNKKGNILWIPVGMGKTLIVLYYIKYLIDNNLMPEYCIYTLPPSAMDNIIKEINYFNLPYLVIEKHKHVKNQVINLIKHDHLRFLEEELKNVAPNSLIIFDEFHYFFNETIRTKVGLELSKLSHDFVCLSGTVIKDTNIKSLIRWLEQIVDFEVNLNNYWAAVSAMISKKVYTRVAVERYEIEAPIDKRYYETTSFKEKVAICYESCYIVMIDYVIEYINQGQRVFLVAKNYNIQEKFKNMLMEKGLDEKHIFLITKDNTITIDDKYQGDIYCVITTLHHNTGYTLSGITIMITSVYFTNEFVREQLEGRINRINQISNVIYIITVYSGLLYYVLEKYKKTRNLVEAFKQFATEINVNVKEF